ncbi:MAG: hypothetical protein KAJ07_02070 [Planctomycetes bacterium]|nr:hypothetical protein [Planctomycetota bacterium]
MGRYEKEASQCVDEIRHCCNHAGDTGYSQAEYYYQKLSDLISRAHNSKHNKSDAGIIILLREEVEPLMQEMMVREEEHKQSKD